MLEGSMIPLVGYAAGWKRSDLENLRGRPEYYTTRDISTRTAERLNDFTGDPYCPLLYVQAQPSSTLSHFLPVRIFLVTKEKETYYIFYTNAIFFLCYTTLWFVALIRQVFGITRVPRSEVTVDELVIISSLQIANISVVFDWLYFLNYTHAHTHIYIYIYIYGGTQDVMDTVIRVQIPADCISCSTNRIGKGMNPFITRQL